LSALSFLLVAASISCSVLRYLLAPSVSLKPVTLSFWNMFWLSAFCMSGIFLLVSMRPRIIGQLSNMKRRNSFVLDEKDDKAVQLFSELGMPKNLAKTLMYISQVQECRSADVEQGADLRQPEVSVAMQEMRRRGWAKKRDLKKKGKGRPVHIYKLTKPLPQILKSFEQDKMKQVQTIKNDLSELQTLIKGYK